MERWIVTVEHEATVSGPRFYWQVDRDEGDHMVCVDAGRSNNILDVQDDIGSVIDNEVCRDRS